jgi:predicted AlkP superfamily pyrophosphatase or phosphodiesterase
MKTLLALVVIICFTNAAKAQNNLERPKLVIGIVVDQMRWDYLYRYYDRYDANGGFKRLLNKGFSCENTLIPYAQSVTACGHSSIYSGSVPAINGITGNTWYDYALNKVVYCTADDSVNTVGSDSKNGKMSPRNLLVTNLCDELKLATNFRGKVIGVALKDRGSILPAGHAADAAYWFDITNGNWITSTYYMKTLPAWVTDLNNKKLADKYYEQGWKTLYPIETYNQSSRDESGGKKGVFGADNSFPYKLSQFAGKNYTAIEVTPFGNAITLEVAKAALQNEQLGKDSITDILAVSLSSPDYIGHTFGPNSVEAEDNYLRLDRDLGDFLTYLDEKVGQNQYLVFLTADHGVLQVPAYLENHNIPAGNYQTQKTVEELNALLQDKFKASNLIIDILNDQVYLNRDAVSKLKNNPKDVNTFIIDYLQKQPFISRAFALNDLDGVALNSVIQSKAANAYLPQRSGDIEVITKPQWIEGFEGSGTTHGTWYPYDAHIPLLWYGWKIKPGHSVRPTSMTDIAPTVSALLHIQAPSGNVGNPIPEVIQ